MLQVMTLLNLAGVAHAVDTALAGCTKSVLISTFQALMFWILPLIGPHGEQLQQLLDCVLRDDDDDNCWT